MRLPPELAALVEPCTVDHGHGPCLRVEPDPADWCDECRLTGQVIATLRAVADDARLEAPLKVRSHPLNIYADRLTELADQIERGTT